MSLKKAERAVKRGEIDQAKRLVLAELKKNKDNVDAWEMAVELSSPGRELQSAERGLQRARQRVASPPPTDSLDSLLGDFDEPRSSQPALSGGGLLPDLNEPTTTRDPVNLDFDSAQELSPAADGEEENFLVKAIISLVLYYVGFFVGGVISNVIFLRQAREAEEQGIPTRNAGCLRILLIVQLVLFGLGVLAAVLLFVLPLVGIGLLGGV